jgi:hypothetical protein
VKSLAKRALGETGAQGLPLSQNAKHLIEFRQSVIEAAHPYNEA